MHQTRQAVSSLIPIKRKGTKYVVRAASHSKNSVPVLIAVRDMLHLASTSKEVKHMIHKKMLKLNDRPVRKINESIKLFSIFEADKPYLLTLTSTGRFSLIPSNVKNRICKVVSRRLVKGGKLQAGLHDGSNIIIRKDIEIGDSLALDFQGKIVEHKKLKKGSKVFIIKGKYKGMHGNIEEQSDKALKVAFPDSAANLSKNEVIVI